MAIVRKSVLVPHAQAQMYELVARVQDYPEFVPWCSGARILEVTAEATIARVDMDYHGVRTHWTTANTNRPPGEIRVTLREGPFRALDGTWRFNALGDTGSKVEFDLHYEFSTPLLARVIGPVFGHVASSFIDAFVRRADAVYSSNR